MPTFARRLALAALAGLAAPLLALAQSAAPEPPPVLSDDAQRVVGARAAAAVPGARVVVQVGQLDPRLKLAPCAQIAPQMAPGAPLMGRTRLMLVCVRGEKNWRVSLPVTVQVFAQAQVAATALPAGTELQAAHLRLAEVDLAAAPSPAVREAAAVVGRTLARPLAEGAALRQSDLKARQWFASGDTVRVLTGGPGWRISSTGQALTPGLEGSAARVRLDSGRVVQGQPSGPREVTL